jgi:uncharacterized membrane protein
MKKLVILFAIILLQLHLASAISFINVYIDESGEAEFLGETDETTLDLLSGLYLSNGEIRGTTSEMTNKQGELWSISYSLENSEIDLIFPKGTTIKSVENGEIYVSSEGIISVYFIDHIELTYTIEKTPEPLTAPKNLLLIIVLAIILILLIFYVINYSNRDHPEPKEEQKTSKPKPKKKEIDKLSLIKKVLSEREKLIVNKLKSTGKIKSSYLRKMCDIPKASFSRHIQELEKKGLIKRTGEGKNKFVELIK